MPWLTRGRDRQAVRRIVFPRTPRADPTLDSEIGQTRPNSARRVDVLLRCEEGAIDMKRLAGSET
ncbi:hypothetical protein B5V46_06765 [Rhodovulum sp. MB263]|nr:hypothetical protein B5V46_06765 [Rhodovulum sp. MB263]